MKNSPTITVDLADRADRSVRMLFGHDAPLTHAISEITDNLRSDIHRMRSGQSAGPVTLSLVGRVGEGKSWLTRTFLAEDDPANSVVQSGQNAAERSMELTWLGSQHPFTELGEGERFIKVSPQSMLDLGAPYILSDSPGYSDHNPTLEALSSLALASSNVKLLATSTSHIRDSSLAAFVGSMDGSLIIPIVRFRPEGDSLTPSEEVKNDCLTEMQQWIIKAPNASILPAVFVPDAGIAGEAESRQFVRQKLAAALTPLISDPSTLSKHKESQLHQRIQLTRSYLSEALVEFRQRIGTPVEKLDQLTATLPEIVQKEVIGDTKQLDIGIRSRFRADAIERTPALIFPFRSLMGVLGLTQGAWDRLIFTTLGSVPSLVMTAFHSVKSWNKTKDFEENLREQSRQRLNSLINDAYRDDIKNFSHALTAVTNETGPDGDTTVNQNQDVIEIHGLTGLEIEAQEIISDAVDRRRIGGIKLYIGGLLVFLIFWSMLLGPVAPLYADYICTLIETVLSPNDAVGAWKNFPTPHASLWITSFMLSIIPALMISMLVMHNACRRARVTKTSKHIETRLADSIKNRIESDKIRLVINNPKLDAAKTLLHLSRRN